MCLHELMVQQMVLNSWFEAWISEHNGTFCAFSMTDVKGCDIDVSVSTTYKLNYVLVVNIYDQIQPIHIGMSLAMIKQLLLHDGIRELLQGNED